VLYALSLTDMHKEVHTKQHFQESLTEAIKANDTVALQKLYEENYPKVGMHVLRNSGSKDQAKDIFQEAMIALWKAVKSDRFEAKSPTALQGYLFTIARNKWTDYLRSSSFKKEISSEKVMTYLEETDEEVEEDMGVHKLEQARVAFKQLGTDCKDLLTKFYFDRMSIESIAQLLDLDKASARNKKYRCMQKLKALVVTNNTPNE